jgi:DNA replication protein DnaC
MEKITNLTHVNGGDIAETLENIFIIDNYSYVFMDLFVKIKEVENFLNDLKTIFKDLKIKIYKFGAHSKIYCYNDEIYINALKYKSFTMNVYTKDLEVADKFYEFYYKKYYEVDKDIKIIFTEYYMTERNMAKNVKTLELKDFKNINEKYYPYIDIDKFMDEFIFGDENILILCGEPGTGKSKFASLIMKKLLENKKYVEAFKIDEEFNFGWDGEIYYSVSTAKNVDMVATDQFWTNVKETDLLILDDLDFLLSARKENREDVVKNQFLSNLLSFTDGIEKNNTKIVITTNQPFETIDEALLRKGRLFAILEFRPLEYKEALELWKSEGLSKKEFDKIFGEIDMIKHSDIGEAINNIKRNKKYVSKKEFIKDPTINVLSKVTNRRVGLI